MSERGRQIPYDTTYKWALNYETNEPIYEAETESQTERTDVIPGARGRGGTDWEFGISKGKSVYIKWIDNKILLQSTGDYIQYLVINHNGK